MKAIMSPAESSFVMAGPVPAIHVFAAWKKGVDARNKCGHDGKA